MSFSRINAGGWGFGDKLTSAQTNSLDIDHANAMDKTGDTLGSGIIVVNSTGQLQSGVAAGIKTTAVGGIQLAGGSTDWITLNPVRSISFLYNLGDIGTNLTSNGTNGRFMTQTGSGQGLTLPLPRLHNGAVLASAQLGFVASTSYAGNPSPGDGNYPTLQIERITAATPEAGDVSLAVSAATISGYVDGNAYYNSGATNTALVLTCTQNNTIDTSLYTYYASLTGEHGANYQNGTHYHWLKLTFTVSDMRFQ